jgi:chromosome segregation ATPase
MTPPASDPAPALVRAAQDLDDELRHSEEAVAEAAKVRLNTEKNIGRAARALQKAGEHREQTAVKANALMAAIQAAHGRAMEASSRMETRASEIQARVAQLQALQARAGEIVASVRQITESAKDAKGAREILDLLGPLDARVVGVLEEARAQDFDDAAHEIAGIRETIAALRRKLGGS